MLSTRSRGLLRALKLREGSLTALPVTTLVHHQGAAAVALARVLAGGGGAQHAGSDVVRGVVSVSYTS